MKKQLITFSFLIVFSLNVRSQWINSVTISPANPTTTDSVVAYVDMDFTSGSCNNSTQYHSQVGNSFTAYTLHCLGMLSFICNDIDTFNLGVLPAGSYTFTVGVDQGSGIPNCSPGIVPGPSQTVPFTVSLPTGILYLDLKKYGYTLFPNPANDFVVFKTMDPTLVANSVLEIFSSDGKKVKELSGLNNEQKIELQLPYGLYVYRLRNENTVGDSQRLLVK